MGCDAYPGLDASRIASGLFPNGMIPELGVGFVACGEIEVTRPAEIEAPEDEEEDVD